MEAVYRTVLAHSTWGVSDVAAHLRMSEDEVRAALDMLAEMSLLRPSWANPDEYRVVSPEVGLTSLLARTEAELQQQQQEIETVRSAIAILSAEHRDTYDRQA